MTLNSDLSPEVFKKYQQFIYDEVGISLGEHKRTLVQSRLRKWLKQYNLTSYEALYEKIANDRSGQMLGMLVNSITTNVTSFFREKNQWVYLKNNLLKIADTKNKKIRIWSAACSSGEEPYSIIIFLKDNLVDFESWDIKILATDISEEILAQAIRGSYSQKAIGDLPRNIVQKYFIQSKNEKGEKIYTIIDTLKQYITFRVFNLVNGDFTLFQKKFDMIFCRNVMIYFDRVTQDALLDRYAKLLGKRSRLFIGHSESIHNKNNKYKMEIPSIYKII